jgi:hypothetical protein
MIIKNSQQDVNIEEPIHVKKVSRKISGGADSAIVGYMLSKYVAEERPDIKIFPLTTNHPKKPYQGVYASRIINFYKEIFGEHIFGKHYINTVDVMDTNEDYINAQTTNMEKAYKNEKIQRNYSGITSNPPLDIIDTFRKPNGKLIKGPVDDRNGKDFPVYKNYSWKHLANIDKKGVAELYETLGVMETLFPLTRSCEAYAHESHYNIDKHCEKCWFCMERFWGFDHYE